MQQRFIIRIALFLAAWLGLMAVPAAACDTSNDSASLGSYSSFTVASNIIKASSTSGIRCVSLFEVLSNSYIAIRVNSTDFRLKNTQNNDTIPFIMSWNDGGPQLIPGQLITDQSTRIFDFLGQNGGRVPLYHRTSPTTGISAGTYEANISLSWFYSVCLVGVGPFCIPEQSPGLTRTCLFGVCLGPVTNWGSGETVNLRLRLVVEKDCIINAPTINFGSAPVASAFRDVVQTVDVRCTAGSPYAVQLNDGNNPNNGVRRMRSGNNYLQYDVFQGTSGNRRWGSSTAERRSSASADINPNQHTGLVSQGYRYRAQVRPDQNAPAGNYSDTLRLDVVF